MKPSVITMVQHPEKYIVAGSLLGIAMLSWWTTFFDSAMMGMPSLPLNITFLVVFTVSWAIGMIVMMFPTTIPMMLMFLRVGKNSTKEIRSGGGPTLMKAFLFIFSYISIWVSVGILFYLAIAITSSIFDLGMFFTASFGTGLAFVIMATYQLSPLKIECLQRCHPTSFLFRHYSGGLLGALKMGASYAKYCVGCCWVMMFFLLLVGSMGAIWMTVFAGIIFVERVLAARKLPSKVIGAGFLAWGVIFLML